MLEWNKPSKKPTFEKGTYAKKYARVLADDEGGFIREAFYDVKDDYYFALGINRRDNLYEIPLLISRWTYLPKSEN